MGCSAPLVAVSERFEKKCDQSWCVQAYTALPTPGRSPCNNVDSKVGSGWARRLRYFPPITNQQEREQFHWGEGGAGGGWQRDRPQVSAANAITLGCPTSDTTCVPPRDSHLRAVLPPHCLVLQQPPNPGTCAGGGGGRVRTCRAGPPTPSPWARCTRDGVKSPTARATAPSSVGGCSLSKRRASPGTLKPGTHDVAGDARRQETLTPVQVCSCRGSQTRRLARRWGGGGAGGGRPGQHPEG